MTDISPPEPVIELLELQEELSGDMERSRWSRKSKLEARSKLRKLDRLLREVRERHRGYLGGDDVFSGVEEIRETTRRRIGGI